MTIQKYPEWFLWFLEHGVRILILLAIAIGALALVYARSLGRTPQERLDAIEETVQYEPPSARTRRRTWTSTPPPDVSVGFASGSSQACLCPDLLAHLLRWRAARICSEAMLSVRNVPIHEEPHLREHRSTTTIRMR